MNRFFISLATVYSLIAMPLAHGQANPDAPILIHHNVLQVPLLRAGFGQSDLNQEADEDLFGDNLGPSRAIGGETISITFKNPKQINEVKLTSYSNSQKGKVLIHKVKGVREDKSIEEFGRFNQVMLEAKEFFNERLDQELKALHFQVEGYTHNDASLLIEISSDDGFAESELSIRRGRSQAKGKYGDYFDESDYLNFNYSDFKNLFETSRMPTEQELLDTSWVCTSYAWDSVNSRTTKAIDYKTRKFFRNKNGILSSVTNLDNNPALWIKTEDGFAAKSPSTQSCYRTISSWIILRATPAGNIVSEVVSLKEDLYRLCAHLFPKKITDNILRAHKRVPAYLSDKYIVGSREFCRPAQF